MVPCGIYMYVYVCVYIYVYECASIYNTAGGNFTCYVVGCVIQTYNHLVLIQQMESFFFAD